MIRDNSTLRAGDRDPTFGSDGELTLSILPDYIGTDRLIKGVLPLPDGKIIVSVGVSMVEAFGFRYGLVRLTQDGKLDESFGNKGVITNAFRNNKDSNGGRLLRLADGRLLMLGVIIPNEVNDAAHLAMACFTADYALDKSFGGSGTGHLVIDNQPTEVYIADTAKVAQQADGKLLISTTYHRLGAWRVTTGVLYRLHPNGTVDTTFNGTGRLELKGQDPEASTGLNACLVQADDKFIVAGHICFQPQRGTALVARFDKDGVIDTTFGHRNTPGYCTVPVGSDWTQFNDLLPTARGFIGVGEAGANPPSAENKGLLVGISKEGLMDPDFNKGEPVLTKYSANVDNAWADGYVQTEGELVIPTKWGDARTSRWEKSGNADLQFGTGGVVSEGYLITGQPTMVVGRLDRKILWSGNPIGIGGSLGKLVSYLG